MNKRVFLFVAAALFLSSNAFSQTADSLIIPTQFVQPGDSANISIDLVSYSFPVSGFSVKLLIPDTAQISILGVDRGDSVDDFAYFQANKNSDILTIVGFANFPLHDQVPPLDNGTNEIAVLRIQVSEDAELGSYANICFYQTDDLTNVITDSTGYLVVQPHTIDGTVVFGSEVSVGEQGSIPSSFNLGDSYPNPFNAHTIIEYSLANYGYVSLVVYDIMGRKVNSLVNNYLSPGNYQVTWDGRNNSGEVLSSGVYFYSLTVDGSQITKKLNFIK